ncbi:carbohydrate ABC transporter permease, partial [Candidatus Hydrogenedentota bacterium]
FITEKGAMMWGASAQVNKLTRLPDLDFEWGVFYPPPLTKESSRFASDQPMCVIFPLLVAKLIFSLSSERARYIYRIIFLVPIVVPGVAVHMIWGQLIYNEMGGLLNEILRLVGLASWTRGWLTDVDTVLLALAFVGFPFASGINVLIYYAGFASIPESVHEAAQLDGARGIKKLFLIDVPLILSQIKLLVILTIIAGVQGFEMIFILTKDGPGFKSMVPGFWMYLNAFSFQRMGYACAIGVVLFIMILGITILNLKYFKSAEAAQGIEE